MKTYVEGHGSSLRQRQTLKMSSATKCLWNFKGALVIARDHLYT